MTWNVVKTRMTYVVLAAMDVCLVEELSSYCFSYFCTI